MARIESLGSFVVGHRTIDRDHRQLVDLTNRMEAAAFGATVPFRKLLDDTVRRAARHFHQEEAILRAIGYPETDRHARYHGGLLARATALRDACGMAADRRRCESTAAAIRRLIIDEVVKDDIEFKSFLNARPGPADRTTGARPA